MNDSWQGREFCILGLLIHLYSHQSLLTQGVISSSFSTRLKVTVSSRCVIGIIFFFLISCWNLRFLFQYRSSHLAAFKKSTCLVTTFVFVCVYLSRQENKDLYSKKKRKKERKSDLCVHVTVSPVAVKEKIIITRWSAVPLTLACTVPPLCPWHGGTYLYSP